MKNYIIFAALACFCLGITAPAEAKLGRFSRACRFDTLPSPSKTYLNAFFVEAGAPSTLANMASRPLNKQALYWIHESITTDYYAVRYYLFAKSVVYVKGRPDKGDPNNFNEIASYRSNWSVNQVKKSIRENPYFSPAYVNRWAPLYNARAGDPRIMVYWHMLNAPVETPVPANYFKVVGRHFYYDAQSGSEIDYGWSESYDCNGLNLGLGLFDW